MELHAGLGKSGGCNIMFKEHHNPKGNSVKLSLGNLSNLFVAMKIIVHYSMRGIEQHEDDNHSRNESKSDSKSAAMVLAE